jgi:glycosyltransferase involved in cell wall biosynthesis
MVVRGHDVHLVVLRPTLDEQIAIDLPHTHLDMQRTPLSVAMGLMRGARFLREFKPDVVHSHGFHGNIVARLLRPFGCAPISTIHNIYEGGASRMLAYRLTDFLSLRTTAVSRAAGDRFVEQRAVPQAKLRVLTNGIDLAQFAPSPARRATLRGEMNAADRFVWLTAGRLSPAKDYPNLIRAFALARSARRPMELWIAGGAAQTAGGAAAELAALKALAAELGAGDAIRWLGLCDDMPALLDAADGFVLASAWEGMPLVLGEAMAMEKPVVATDVGGVRELVADCGWLVPARKPEALAAAILQVVDMPVEEREASGRAARERITEHFSMESRADEWEAIYRLACARSK